MSIETRGISPPVLGPLSNCLVDGDPEQNRRDRTLRRRAILISIIFQIIVVAALLLFPLLGKSERIAYEPIILTPFPRLGHRDPHPGAHPKSRPAITNACHFCPTLHPPTPIDPQEATTGDTSAPAEPGNIGDPNGDPNGVSFVAVNSDSHPRPPEEPVVEKKPTVTPRLRVATIEPAMLIRRVEPTYPPLAKQTRREGRVELHAIIATDGTIQSLQVVSGDPLLIQSALAAVREWRYRPTILNGQAVEIDTQITVTYTLNR